LLGVGSGLEAPRQSDAQACALALALALALAVVSGHVGTESAPLPRPRVAVGRRRKPVGRRATALEEDGPRGLAARARPEARQQKGLAGCLLAHEAAAAATAAVAAAAKVSIAACETDRRPEPGCRRPRNGMVKHRLLISSWVAATAVSALLAGPEAIGQAGHPAANERQRCNRRNV
jgi:hypothetical protein